MSMTPQELADYKKNGYVVVRQLFDKKDVASIHRDTREVFGIQFGRLFGTELRHACEMGNEDFSRLMFDLFNQDFELFSNCSKQVQHLISLHELGVSNRLVEVLRELGLQRPILSVRPCILMNSRHLDKAGDRGRYWRLPSHQDWYYSQGSLDSVTVWLPHVACNKEIGALELLPGSHLWGLQPAEGSYGEMDRECPDDQYVSHEMEPGDVLIFVSLLVHRSGVNSTAMVRWSSQFRFNNLLEPTFAERKFPNPFAYHPTRVLATSGFPTKEKLKEFFSVARVLAL
jgi:ectoine hydroxylase-related dioxygenase (phytanoyl-CoA dioxygenase family)